MNNDWRTARPFVLAGSVLGLGFLGFLLLLELRQIVAVLFLGVVVGVSLNPVVEKLVIFKLPRVIGVLLVYSLVGTLLGVFIYFAALQFSQEAFDFKLDQIRADYDDLAADSILPPSEDLEEAGRALAQNAVGGLLNQAFSLINAAFSVFTVLFTGLLFTITQERMRALLLMFLRPRDRERADELLKKLAKGLRRFMVGELVAMTAVGITTFVGLVIIGVEFPLLLAFIAFLTEAIPMIGPWLAFLPAFAVAMTDGPWTAAQVAVLFLIIQGIENYIITPLVHGRQSEMPALLIFIALLIGGALMGILGALVALPAAVCLYILFFELIVPWNQRRLGETPPVADVLLEDST